MRQKMSKGARRELLLTLQPQYREAAWTSKQQILDGFVAATGYDRKYAISLLNSDVKTVAVRRERGRRYGDDIRDILLHVWRKAGNSLCSKRLVPILPTLIAKMEEFGHLQVSDEQKARLGSLSAATVDRLLKPERAKHPRGRGTTKPGFLIKKHVPIRTFADWNDAKPGFLEADLVAHCGDNVRGQFLNTLTATDISTTWTETVALLRRSEADVINGLTEIQSLLPFAILGVDTDNGGEFINYTLVEWCKKNKVTFTRAREYKKNDQCHVEEKNGSVVRRLIGYDRYEGIESWQLLSTLYRVYRLYVNFFQPSFKLLSKSRDGARVYRRYDKALTPFERVLDSGTVCEEAKKRLRREFKLLDPVLLLSEIERLQQEFWQTATIFREYRSSNDLQKDGTEDAPVLTGESLPPPSPRRKRNDKPAVSQQHTGKKRGRGTILDEVWPEVCDQLKEDPSLSRTKILAWLQQRYPKRFKRTQVDTIGRKLQLWRDEHHPGRDWGTKKRGRETVIDEVWTEICDELEKNPILTARQIMEMLCQRYPGKFRMTQLTTVFQRLKKWRMKNIQSLSLLVEEPLSEAATPSPTRA